MNELQEVLHFRDGARVINPQLRGRYYTNWGGCQILFEKLGFEGSL